MGIRAIIIINNHGQSRLARFYDDTPFSQHESFIRDCFTAVSKRSDSLCNFLEGSQFGSDIKLIYRHYATLFFIFAVDGAESELGILDLIQVFVEALDKCFENVCELDLIFHLDRVHQVLDEIIFDGCVMETSVSLFSSIHVSVSLFLLPQQFAQRDHQRCQSDRCLCQGN